MTPGFSFRDIEQALPYRVRSPGCDENNLLYSEERLMYKGANLDGQKRKSLANVLVTQFCGA